MKITQRYIHPPRAETKLTIEATTAYADQAQYTAQLKFNDSHLLIWATGPETYTLWNRHKEPLKYTPTPELHTAILQVLDKLQVKTWTLLDGGLLHNKHPHPWLKNKIALWDILVHNDEYLTGTTAQQRYTQLFTIAETSSTAYLPTKTKEVYLGYWITPGIILPRNIPYPLWRKTWDEDILVANQDWPNPCLEGLVIKDMNAKLKLSVSETNNSHMVTRCRVATGRHRF